MSRRRLRRIGSIRRLKSGRVEVRVRGNTADGAPFILRRVVAEEHADQVLSEFRTLARQYKDGIAAPSTKITLDEYCRQFRKRYSWSSERNSTWLLLRPLWKLPISKIGDSDVSAWASSVLWTGAGRAPRGSGKASRSYILHAYELLRRILRQAVVDGMLPVLRLSARPLGIPSQKQARKKRRPFSLGEVARIFEAARAKGGDLALRFELSASTGLRPKELINAQIAYFLPADSYCEGAPPGAAVLDMPAIKGGKPHFAPIPPELAQRIRDHIDGLTPEARDTGLLFPIRRPDGSWSKRKKWVTRDTWRETFRAANIPEDCVFYQLRHTRISQWSNRTDIGARRAADLVGHADMRTTEEYAARARGLVPAAFESPLSNPDEKPPQKPEKPTPGPGRKKKGKKQVSEKRAPVEGIPSPQNSACPRNARSRLETLADELDRTSPAEVAGRLADLIGAECTRFVSELRAELSDIGDSGLSARLQPLCDAIAENRTKYLRLVPAPVEGADGATGARKVGA